MNYYVTEIAISERFVVQLVFDDREKLIATRVLDTYTDDYVPDSANTRQCIRRAIRQAV